MSSAVRKASCQSSRSTAVLSCWKRVSRWRWSVSGSLRLIECDWCEYFWDEVRCERRVSERRRNSVLRWWVRQKAKASCETVWEKAKQG